LPALPEAVLKLFRVAAKAWGMVLSKMRPTGNEHMYSGSTRVALITAVD
jgi:hypothetical protein